MRGANVSVIIGNGAGIIVRYLFLNVLVLTGTMLTVSVRMYVRHLPLVALLVLSGALIIAGVNVLTCDAALIVRLVLAKGMYFLVQNVVEDGILTLLPVLVSSSLSGQKIITLKVIQ